MTRRTVLKRATAGVGGLLGVGATTGTMWLGDGDEERIPDAVERETATPERETATARPEPPTAEPEPEPTTAEPPADWTESLTFGANLNGRPRRLRDDLDLLGASNTTWVRAFIDVRDKLDARVPPRRDPDVAALRKIARQTDCRLIVSLKWGFKVNWEWDEKESIRVPEPGSERERELLQCATDCLRGIAAPVDVVVLGNEPMYETKSADIAGENPPVVRFTRNLKDHLLQHGDHGTPRYLLGAFNRLYDDRVREHRYAELCREMFRFAREDDDIDGVDLHVHYDTLAEARKMIEVARERLPDGTLTVTECSPVVRHNRHVRTPIGEWQTGREFADEYGYAPETTAVDFFERAKAEPRPQREMAAFYEAMPWYRADELERSYRVFEQSDVSVATFGFLQDVGMRNTDWRRPGWMPFHINHLYQKALMRGRGTNALYIDDYRRFAG